MDAALPVKSYQGRVEGKDNFPQCSDSALANAAQEIQDNFSLLKGTLLGHGLFVVHQHLLCSANFQQINSQLVLVHAAIPPHVRMPLLNFMNFLFSQHFNQSGSLRIASQNSRHQPLLSILYYHQTC